MRIMALTRYTLDSEKYVKVSELIELILKLEVKNNTPSVIKFSRELRKEINGYA